MKKRVYTPRLISVSPRSIVPFHNPQSLKLSLVSSYMSDFYVPPVPIIHASSDLKDLGDYVNYNGHHRTLAARVAIKLRGDFNISCVLVEEWRDICYLRDNPPLYGGVIYQEYLDGLENSFDSHRSFVLDEARRFRKLSEIAFSKDISYGYDF